MRNIKYITSTFNVFGNKVKINWFIIVCCILMMISLIVLQELWTDGLLFAVIALPYFLVLLPFAIISSIYFICKGKKPVKTLLWFILCLIAFGIMIVPFFFEFPGVWRLWFEFLPFPISLIGTVLIFDSKDPFRKGYSKFLLIVIFLCMPTMLCFTLPRIYSPPALTQKSIKTYNKAIYFLLYESKFDLQDPNLAGSDVINKLDEALPDKLFLQLLKTNCWKFRVSGGIAMFWKYGNRIFPPGPGVAYSLYGNNPNDINDEYVNKIKPFESITGNWYLSRNMTLAGPRRDVRIKTPKALIDRSKVISGVSDEELHRFGNRQTQKDSNSRQEDSNETN